MKAMSHEEMTKIRNEVDKHHCLIEGRRIKYMNMDYDFRTHEIWRLTFRPFISDPITFTVTNRFDNPKHDNLFDEVMEWLKNGQEEEHNEIKGGGK